MKDSSFFDTSENSLWQKLNCGIYEDDILHSGVLEYQKKLTKFCLLNNRLVKCNSKNIPSEYIELLTARLNVIDQESLAIFKNNKSFILKSSPQNIQFWFDCLKNKVILNNFVSNYEIGQLIGQGQFAQVYCVKNRANTLKYAAKVFQKSYLANINVGKDSLIKEIKVLRQLKHQGIIKLYEVYEDAKNIYLVQELMQYSLKSQKVIYTEPKAANIMLQIFTALNYIHKNQIIHRDIKPDNILFKNENTITIGDFGLADYYNPESKYEFKRCGTPGFVAPEILRDQNYDFKVDVYSAGIILYQMITGKLPFSASSQNQIVRKNYNAIIDFNCIKASPKCIQFTKLLLQENPLMRPSAYEVMHHEWFVTNLGEMRYFQLINQDDQHLTTLKNSMHQISNFMAIQNQMDEEEDEQSKQEQPLQQAINKYQDMINNILQEKQSKEFFTLKEQLFKQFQQMSNN